MAEKNAEVAGVPACSGQESEGALALVRLGCLQGRQVSHKDCGPCWHCHLPCPLAQPLPCPAGVGV